MKQQKMLLRRKTPCLLDGKWASKQEEFEVIFLCGDGKWAMVRRKGCMPFVVEAKDLHALG